MKRDLWEILKGLLLFMIEYKEVSTRRGKKLVFCNFEELLMDFYKVGSMEEVEPHACSNGEYIIHCPFCKSEGHTKHKLYIKKDLTVGHCFVCTRDFIHVSDEVDTTFNISDSLTNRAWIEQGTSCQFKPTILMDPNWTIDKFATEFENYSEEGYRYLLRRHMFMSELWKILDFKFWDGNPVIPFKRDGQVIYYQIRFMNPGGKIKYFMPPIKNKPPYIIEREGPARKRLMVVEGIFDAIAALIQCPDYTPVAVLGSSVSDYQIDYIKDYSGVVEDIKIWMDETKISAKIAQRLKYAFSYAPVGIIRSTGPDPEEVMVDRMRRGLPLQWIKYDNSRLV